MRSLTYLYRTMGPAKTGTDPVTAITPKPAAEARQATGHTQPARQAADTANILSDLR